MNGADVARKLAILSRTIPALRSALPEGYNSVETRSLVPKAIDGLATGSEFMSRLPEFDTEFDTLRAEAQKEGKVLRYVGVIDVEKGVIKASLEKFVFFLVLISLLDLFTNFSQVRKYACICNLLRWFGQYHNVP